LIIAGALLAEYRLQGAGAIQVGDGGQRFLFAGLPRYHVEHVERRRWRTAQGQRKVFSAYSARTIFRATRFQASRARVSTFLSEQRVDNDGIAGLCASTINAPGKSNVRIEGTSYQRWLLLKKANKLTLYCRDSGRIADELHGFLHHL
jgi:hypothetical protein